MIDLDGGGPIPPAKLVCRLEEGGEVVKKIKPNMLSAEKMDKYHLKSKGAGEVVTEVEHDLKEETKVDGQLKEIKKITKKQGGRVPGGWVLLSACHLPCS